jgi:hypothetical protein
MATLLVALYAVESIVRIPTMHHMALQFRPGAPAFLEKLAQRQLEKGDLEVALIASQTEFFAPKLFEPITSKYPKFHVIADIQGGSGHYVLEKHWREIAMQKNVQHSLRIMVVGPHKGVARIWNAQETVCVEPYVALEKRERAKLRAEAKATGKKEKEDFTMRNLGFVIEDVLAAPSLSVKEILKTSAWVNSAHYNMMGETFAVVQDG